MSCWANLGSLVASSPPEGCVNETEGNPEFRRYALYARVVNQEDSWYRKYNLIQAALIPRTHQISL